jgi:putative lipoic acid-binding regulatory protein
MTYSMKSENKLDGASNFRAWKTRIDLILAKNKVLDIVKGKIVEPEFEEGKEKEPQNVAVMEKFKDNDINAMSIIVDSIKDHLIPYISHLDSSKKMYDALTNLFSVRNIGQVMSLKNELRDMKMNDDDNITSFVRISQLRDQLQAIEEIISEKELVNIVLNGLPKTWDAFAASMNTRKEYPTFEELWTCCDQEESRISAKEKPQKKYDDQAFTARFRDFRNKKKFGSKKKTNQEKDMSRIQCFNFRKYGHYKNHCPELKKGRKHTKHQLLKKGNPQRKPNRTKHTSSSKTR